MLGALFLYTDNPQRLCCVADQSVFFRKRAATSSLMPCLRRMSGSRFRDARHAAAIQQRTAVELVPLPFRQPYVHGGIAVGVLAVGHPVPVGAAVENVISRIVKKRPAVSCQQSVIEDASLAGLHVGTPGLRLYVAVKAVECARTPEQHARGRPRRAVRQGVYMVLISLSYKASAGPFWRAHADPSQANRYRWRRESRPLRRRCSRTPSTARRTQSRSPPATDCRCTGC